MLSSIRTLSRVANQAQHVSSVAVALNRWRSTDTASNSPLQTVTVDSSYKVDLPLKEFSSIPGPRQWPVLGSYPALHGHTHELHVLFGQLADRYGSIYQLKLPGRNPLVVVTNIDAIEQMFKVEGKYPRRTFNSPLDWALEKANLPKGVLFTHGGHWRRLRSAINKQIVFSDLLQFLPQINNVSTDFVHLIERKKEDGQVNDIFPLLLSWAFEGLSSIMFGSKVCTMNSSDSSDVSRQLIHSAAKLVQSLTAVIYSPPWYKYFPTADLKQFDAMLHEVYRLGGILKEKRIKEIKETAERGEELEDVGFLGQWMANEKLTEEDILPLVSDFFVAGADTTSTATMFLLHEVAKSEEIQDKLFAEVSTALGDCEDVNSSNIQNLSYAKNCLKEILRMYPSGNIVRNNVEDVVLCGYKVPKNTAVTVPLYAMGRNPKYFDEPSTFCPDRWERSQKHHPFAYIPFGYGPRACYGRRLAELEVVTLLSKIIRKYRISTDQKELVVTLKTILEPTEPVRISFNKR